MNNQHRRELAAREISVHLLTKPESDPVENQNKVKKGNALQ